MAWFSGSIHRISDGSDAFKKGRRKRGNYAGGLCLVRWDSWKDGDADGDSEFDESWVALKKSIFYTERSSEWRLDMPVGVP